MAEYGRKGSRKNSQVNLETLMGTTPPQALEIEEAVLGAMLVEPNCIDDVLGDLSDAECFYSERNGIVFQAIRELHNSHQPVDIYTVTEKLSAIGKLEDAGGAAHIVEMSEKVGAAAHVEYYTKILKQKYIQRELITSSYKTLKDSYDDSIPLENLLDTAQSRIFSLVEKQVAREAQSIGSVINTTLEALEKAQESTGQYSGVPSGFPTLDSMTLGWQPSDLIILAARPSVGKTAFALNVARNAAVMGYPTAVFSLEMPAKQLANRLMISESGIDGKKLKGGVKMQSEDWARLEEQIKKLAAAPLYIDDTPSLPVMEFRSKVKKLVLQKGVRLVVVDYLQLMQGPSELRAMREQEVAAISRTLKATAKEHNIPIIALSQLSRQAVTRQGSNNRPQLSDLRESGSIEQDADMVLFIHRLDYQAFDENVQKGETQLIIAKHRNGEIGDVPLIFRDTQAKFIDASEENLGVELGELKGSAMNDMAGLGDVDGNDWLAGGDMSSPNDLY